MNLKSEKQIEELAKEDARTSGIESHGWTYEIHTDGYKAGYQQAQNDMLESASEGFEDWWHEKYHAEKYETEELYFCHKAESHEVWQASQLCSAKRIAHYEKELGRIKKISQENYSRAEEINEIRTEQLRELREALDWSLSINELRLPHKPVDDKVKQIRQRFFGEGSVFNKKTSE